MLLPFSGTGTQWWRSLASALIVVVLVLLSGCAPRGALRSPPGDASANSYDRPPTPPEHPDGSAEDARAVGRSAGNERSHPLARRPTSSPAEEDPLDERAEGLGWPDGVGDGRPYAAPMSLDWFQGFLVEAGVPTSALPEDGRTLSPTQAMELLPHLVATPVTLGNFGPRRMAAHLLLEVATGGVPVSRDELHARMRRFTRLRVVRPDGYLVKPATGVAEQKVGEVALAKDGTLRAGRFEVGPFYAIEGGRLFPVDDTLEVPRGSHPVGRYEPDDGAILPVAEGAMLAVVDTVEGLYRLVFHPGETLDGLLQLPGVVRELYANAPQQWEQFRHKPYAERVRTLSRLTTGVLLVVGTSGAGAAKAASWGGRLGKVSIPLLSLSGDGVMAMRLVAVPVSGVVSAAAPALSATYVLHMANTRARGADGHGNANDRTRSGGSPRTAPDRHLLQFIEPWRKPQLTSDGRIIPYKNTKNPPDPVVNLGRNRAGKTISDGRTTLRFDKNGFPEFDTGFETLLDDIHIGSKDRLAHYKAANQKLFQAIGEDPSLGRSLGLSPEAINKLPTSTKPPPGYSWHHHQDVGRMQLITTKAHQLAAPHTGGMAIWGGGN
jgi:hypothetical protein